MADERAMKAVGRIQRALTRIEQLPPPARASASGDGERLRLAHQGLRTQVQGAIAQIDRLLADGKAG